jgi:sulfur carrier protein ThiS
MKIYLEYVAMLVVHEARNGGTLDLPEEATVTDLLNQLRLSPAHQRVVTAFINERRVRSTARLSDGDRVFLGLPMGGG